MHAIEFKPGDPPNYIPPLYPLSYILFLTCEANFLHCKRKIPAAKKENYFIKVIFRWKGNLPQLKRKINLSK